MTVTDLIQKHEGLRLFPYNDTVGKITIGYGRNLTDDGITDAEANLMFSDDLARVEESVAEAWPHFNQLDEVREAVILDMVYNMGLGDVLQFKETLDAVAAGNWQAAHDGMLASKWAQQVGSRATEDATMMLTGNWPGEGSAT
jgi:lysozyme